jgi:hypothetical protein
MLGVVLLSVYESAISLTTQDQSGGNGCYIRLALVDPGLRTPNCGVRVLGSWAQIRLTRETNG